MSRRQPFSEDIDYLNKLRDALNKRFELKEESHSEKADNVDDTQTA